MLEAAPLLVLARVCGLCLAAPMFSTAGLSFRTRLGLAVALTFLLTPSAAGRAVPPTDLVSWGSSLLAEFLIGAGLGWSAALIVAGARQAGEIVGAQAGLSPAALLDPDSGDDITALGSLYGWMALGAFLVLDGPLEIVRALSETFRMIPPGAGVITEASAMELVERIGGGLSLAVSMAAPVALALAAAGAALGLIGRASPSLPLIAMSLPIRFGIGLLLVGLGAAAAAGLLQGVWRDWAGRF